MPCDIGYRNYSRVRIPTPQPQELKSRTQAPKIDAELLEQIGEDDQEFLAWLQELDIVPLLQEALKRGLAKIDNGLSNKIKFSITQQGYLEVRTVYKNETQKKQLEAVIDKISNQFLLEVFGIVAELLDYTIHITKTKSRSEEIFVLKGEKNADDLVTKHLQITTQYPQKDARIIFEHFQTEESLNKEERKFLGLAQKLGIKITFLESKLKGKPIQADIVQQSNNRSRLS